MEPKITNFRKEKNTRIGVKLLTMGCLLALSACSNSDDNNPTPSNLEGMWRLSNVSGGIAGTSDDFSDGNIQWTFNANGIVNVVNGNTDDSKVDLIETGNYTYAFIPNTVTPETCAEAFVIDGVSYGCQNISGTTMTLSQVESDGYLITLEKLN